MVAWGSSVYWCDTGDFLFGIAAVIGAGIFSSIGKACFDGGPGVIFLYIFTAVACGFAALCYAEFASTVPIAGSAYTYAYVAFWGDLCMDHRLGFIDGVCHRQHSSSHLLERLLHQTHAQYRPAYLTMAHNGLQYSSQWLLRSQQALEQWVRLCQHSILHFWINT